MVMAEDPRTRCSDCGAKVLIGDLWPDGRCDPCHQFVTDEVSDGMLTLLGIEAP